MSSGSRPRILVVGAGAIGGVLAASVSAAAHPVTVLTTNRNIFEALRARGFRLRGKTKLRDVPAGEVLASLAPETEPFDYVLLATQPPQVEQAAREAAPFLAKTGRMVCFQNGLCEDRVAKIVGEERVLGAVVAWGASAIEPGVYERTSNGGFTIGTLRGEPDEHALELAQLIAAVGPVKVTSNLLGARWSKLAINCAISTLGTIGGDRVGPLLRQRFVRRLALEIMTETVLVARAEKVRLEKVAGTVDLDWLALTDEDRRASRSRGLAAKHAVLIAAGLRYRRLRSSMLAAIERGRPPAVDLNGEVAERGKQHGVSTPVNRAAQEMVWEIAHGKRKSSVTALHHLHAMTK